uniref:Uncharacterized protein n=1 Tax=Ditylenchus dipsaci TaxID=166011 RepID=A0A915CZQ8_9BILA
MKIRHFQSEYREAVLRLPILAFRLTLLIVLQHASTWKSSYQSYGYDRAKWICRMLDVHESNIRTLLADVEYS